MLATRRFTCYADTAPLGDDELRQAATRGLVEDRVLACWRLLVRGQAFRAIGVEGPDSGCRRLVLLNLAVTREFELLETVTCHDPEPLLRIEAMVWIWRVDSERGLDLLARRLLSEPDPAVIIEWSATIVSIPWARLTAPLEQLLAHPYAALRRLALDRLFDVGAPVSAAIERLAAIEVERPLLKHLVTRWAASDDHQHLLALALTRPGARLLVFDALHAAGRRYPFEGLRELIEVGEVHAAVRLLAGPYSPTARAWLLDLLRREFASGKTDDDTLEHLAAAYRGLAPMAADDDDIALLQLLGAAVVTPWGDLRGPLDRLSVAPSYEVRALATAQILRGSDGVPPALRDGILMDYDARVLALWAVSEDHRALLAQCATIDRAPNDVRAVAVREEALRALVAAERRYPWETLAPVADRIADNLAAVAEWELEECVADEAWRLLLDLVERPDAPGPRAWILRTHALGVLRQPANVASLRRRLAALPPDSLPEGICELHALLNDP